MSFAFLPRGVAAKRATAQSGSSENDKPDEMQLDGPASPDSIANTSRRGQARSVSRNSDNVQPTKSSTYQRKPPKAIDPRHLAVLIETSMSDYALWMNKDLRRYAADKHTKGFLALSRLLNESAIIQAAGLTPSEAAILQALKEYGTGFLEMQMKVINSGKHRQVPLSTSTYNIRRVDWENIREKQDEASSDEMARSFWDRSLDEWNERTIYVENIPRKYWSLPSALYFINTLLGTRTSSNDPSSDEMEKKETLLASKIQHLELPAHAKAAEGDLPVCKGFAFITFSDLEDVDACIQRWSWVRSKSIPTVTAVKSSASDDENSDVEFGDEIMNLDLKEKNESEAATKEATKSEFKCMRFKEWDDLKAEYLQRQTALYDVMKTSAHAAHQEASKLSRKQQEKVAPPQSKELFSKGQKDQPPHMGSHSANPAGPMKGSATANDMYYPIGCLLFVKNLHPQTNKTTLKTLFGNLLKTAAREGAGGRATSVEVDYVDWSKGMSSCHLRLSHPTQSQALVSYLSKNRLVQTDGSDASGKDEDDIQGEEFRPLVAELVEGRAESIYWDKVPDKIKTAAIAKLHRYNNAIATSNNANGESEPAIDGISGLSPGASGTSANKMGNEEPGTEEREKKRRRKA